MCRAPYTWVCRIPDTSYTSKYTTLKHSHSRKHPRTCSLAHSQADMRFKLLERESGGKVVQARKDSLFRTVTEPGSGIRRSTAEPQAHLYTSYPRLPYVGIPYVGHHSFPSLHPPPLPTPSHPPILFSVHRSSITTAHFLLPLPHFLTLAFFESFA